MAAGQSEPRGLGHAWRLVDPGVDPPLNDAIAHGPSA